MNTKDLTAADYVVGYKQPPAATKFKRGVSGNPKGRPKGSVDVYSALMRELRCKLNIREGGKVKTITKWEGILKQQVNKAVEGNPKSIAFVMGMHAEAESRLSLREKVILMVHEHDLHSRLNEMTDEELDEIIRLCRERSANECHDTNPEPS